MSVCRIIKTWPKKCVTVTLFCGTKWLDCVVQCSRTDHSANRHIGKEFFPFCAISEVVAMFTTRTNSFHTIQPILFNFIFAYTSRSSKRHPSFRFPHHNLVLNLFLPNAYYTLPVFHSAWFDYYVFWRAQIRKVLMRGREKMTTFVILRHSIGSAWLLSGVQCPFYLSLVDSECVRRDSADSFNPLKPELNPICYLLALLGFHHFLHVSSIRVKLLTFRLLMSYIYGAPILDVSRSHTTTQHSR